MGKRKHSATINQKTTKYNEMIPSMFNWLTPDIQKIRAEELDKATKK